MHNGLKMYYILAILSTPARVSTERSQQYTLTMNQVK